MTDWRLPKIIYEWVLRGRKKRGRPKLTWAQALAQTIEVED